MPLEQQAKEGIAVWAGIVDPHYQVDTSLLFQNGGGLPGIETLLLLEMSHPWSEWKDTQFSQSLSRVWLFATPWTAARQASLSITNSQSPPKPMSIESGMPSNHLILCCPLLLLPSIFPSIRVFSNESALHIRWSSYWSFSFSISPSSEYSGLISFRKDWLDLPAVQGTLKSLLQHHSSLLPNKNNWKLNRGCLLSPPPWLWGCFKFSQLVPPPATWRWPKEPATFGDVYGGSSRTRRFPIHATPAAWPWAMLSAAWPLHSCTSFMPGASAFFSVLWGPRNPSSKFLFCLKKKKKVHGENTCTSFGSQFTQQCPFPQVTLMICFLLISP